MRIGQPNQPPLAERPMNDPFNISALTMFDLTIASGRVTLQITNDTNVDELQADLPAGFVVERVGFIVGREPDGQLSCVDDLTAQAR